MTARANVAVGTPKNIQVPKLISSLPLNRLQASESNIYTYTTKYNVSRDILELIVTCAACALLYPFVILCK